MRFSAALGAFAALFLCTAGAAFAAQTGGVPVNYALGFQPAATPVMENIVWFHNVLLWIITGISVLVLGLLGWVIIRYNDKSNTEPRKFSHNTTVEVVWTALPIVILIVIAVPSFQLLYYQDVIPESDFTIKTTGYQWNWGYEYPDHGGFEYFANMVAAEDIAAHPFESHRNLTTDLPVVVPAGATVRVEVTAADVIHNWAMPSFGVKMDAIPGRLNETWFRVDAPGIYYGQCSELCGLRHAFMPIEVHVVPQEVFDAWVVASNDDPYSAPEVLVAYYDELRSETRVASAQ
jgi:cytochrome c oxidase subunit 2